MALGVSCWLTAMACIMAMAVAGIDIHDAPTDWCEDVHEIIHQTVHSCSSATTDANGHISTCGPWTTAYATTYSTVTVPCTSITSPIPGGSDTSVSALSTTNLPVPVTLTNVTSAFTQPPISFGAGNSSVSSSMIFSSSAFISDSTIAPTSGSEPFPLTSSDSSVVTAEPTASHTSRMTSWSESNYSTSTNFVTGSTIASGSMTDFSTHSSNNTFSISTDFESVPTTSSSMSQDLETSATTLQSTPSSIPGVTSGSQSGSDTSRTVFTAPTITFSSTEDSSTHNSNSDVTLSSMFESTSSTSSSMPPSEPTSLNSSSMLPFQSTSLTSSSMLPSESNSLTSSSMPSSESSGTTPLPPITSPTSGMATGSESRNSTSTSLLAAPSIITSTMTDSSTENSDLTSTPSSWFEPTPLTSSEPSLITPQPTFSTTSLVISSSESSSTSTTPVVGPVPPPGGGAGAPPETIIPPGPPPGPPPGGDGSQGGQNGGNPPGPPGVPFPPLPPFPFPPLPPFPFPPLPPLPGITFPPGPGNPPGPAPGPVGPPPPPPAPTEPPHPADPTETSESTTDSTSQTSSTSTSTESSSSSSSAAPTSTPCVGITSFSRLLVTIDAFEYYVPAYGDPLHLMLNDASGTEVTISHDRIDIGGNSFIVPSAPLLTPTSVTKGGYQVKFRNRPFSEMFLAPPDSIAGQIVAKNAAQDYIDFCKSVSDPVASFLGSALMFFSRYAAPSTAEADRVLGTEATALANLKFSANKVQQFFGEKRQEYWESFLNQIILLDTPPPVETSSDLIPTSIPTGIPGETITSKVYFQKVFAPNPGAQDLCQRAPWRNEGLLNIARFLSRDSWTNSAALVAHLQKYSDSFKANIPTGPAGLAQGSGALVNGAAGFDIVARMDLSRQKDLFENRMFYVSMKRDMSSMWYFRFLTDLLDGSKGEAGGLRHGAYDGAGVTYWFGLNAVQGFPVIYTLEHFAYGVKWVSRHPYNDEEFAQMPAIKFYREDRQSAPSLNGSSTHRVDDEISKGPRTAEPKDDNIRTRLPRADLPEIPVGSDPGNAYFYQRMLSAKGGMRLGDQPYKRADNGGSGITVFVMDTGVTLTPETAAELRLDPQRADEFSYVIPAEIALPSVPEERLLPDTLDDDSDVGHGTSMAAIIAGTTRGIAPAAELYILKITHKVLDKDGDEVLGGMTPEGLDKAFEKGIEVVKERKLEGKAVFTCSIGFDAEHRYYDMMGVFEDRIEELEALGILFVIPAGNDGFSVREPHLPLVYLGDSLPTALGTVDNNVVTVGAVRPNGGYCEWTTPEGRTDEENPFTGSITVWAQGYQVQLMNTANKDYLDSGTSFASPAVAGLIAYLVTLPENADLMAWDPNGPADQGRTLSQKVKRKLVDLSWERRPRNRQLQLPPGLTLPFPLPAHFKVAYNGAWGRQFDCAPQPAANPRMVLSGDPNDDDPDYVCPFQPPTLSTSIVPASISNGGPGSIPTPGSVGTVTLSGIGTLTSTQSSYVGTSSTPNPSSAASSAQSTGSKSVPTSGSVGTSSTRTSSAVVSSAKSTGSKSIPTPGSVETVTLPGIGTLTITQSSYLGTSSTRTPSTVVSSAKSTGSKSIPTPGSVETVTLPGIGTLTITQSSYLGTSSTSTPSTVVSSSKATGSKSIPTPGSVDTVTWGGVTLTITQQSYSRASSTTKTTSSVTALHTIYSNPDGTEGCAKPDCSQCKQDYIQICVNTTISTVCHCKWRGGCKNNVPADQEGLCKQPCAMGYHRTCEDREDMVTYPNGYCQCAPNTAKCSNPYADCNIKCASDHYALCARDGLNDGCTCVEKRCGDRKEGPQKYCENIFGDQCPQGTIPTCVYDAHSEGNCNCIPHFGRSPFDIIASNATRPIFNRTNEGLAPGL